MFEYTEFDHPNYKYIMTANMHVKLDDDDDAFAWFGGIDHQYFTLTPGGVLIVKKGYAWDGLTSFPDCDEWLKASVVHDALIQMCNEGLLIDDLRPECHREMRIILEQTSNKFWAYLIYIGLMVFHPVYRRL